MVYWIWPWLARGDCFSKVKVSGKGIWVQTSIWRHMFFRLHLPWQRAYSVLQLLIHPWICAPGTQYGWMDGGRVEYEVCLAILHMASTENRTPDLLILNPPYPLGHMLSLNGGVYWPSFFVMFQLPMSRSLQIVLMYRLDRVKMSPFNSGDYIVLWYAMKSAFNMIEFGFTLYLVLIFDIHS